MIEIEQPQRSQIVSRLKQCRLDNRCEFRMDFIRSELSSFFQEDLALAIKLVACSEKLMTAIQRGHAVAVEHRSDFYAGVPRLVRLEVHIERQF